MRFVRPEVTCIAQSKPNDEKIAEWLRLLGCSADTVYRYVEGSKENKTAGERIIELAGRRCYLAFEPGLNPNVGKIRADIADYCENILKHGHGSVLEHVTFMFAVENVSRVYTGEMNRHRAGVAISEGSMRYIRYRDIPIVETPLLALQMNEPGELANKKTETRRIIEKHAEFTEQCYEALEQVWAEELAPESTFTDKKNITSMMRRIVPMGVATGGVWTMNLRALRHICTLRSAEGAEEEIALVSGKMLEIMMHLEPVLFGDFSINDRGYWTPKYAKV